MVRFEILGDKERHILIEAEHLLEEGLAYEKKNAYRDAAERYQKALNGFKKLKMNRKIGITQVYLGDVYSKAQQYAEAQKAYAEALSYFDQATDEAYKARILASLGQACFKMEKFQYALDNMESSLEIYRQLKNIGEVEKLERNIEVAKKKLGD